MKTVNPDHDLDDIEDAEFREEEVMCGAMDPQEDAFLRGMEMDWEATHRRKRDDEPEDVF